MLIGAIWWKNLLLLAFDCFEVVAMVAICVSQWPLTLNLCIFVTWPLTCVLHTPWTHTPEIIDMHQGVCNNDNNNNNDDDDDEDDNDDDDDNASDSDSDKDSSDSYSNNDDDCYDDKTVDDNTDNNLGS